MLRRIFLLICICSAGAFAQMPPIEPGVSKSLAEWRAAHYSDVRYKLNLTLEKMSPVLKGTMEIRVKVSEPGAIATGFLPPIVLDWRKIKGHEDKSTIVNVSINGLPALPEFDGTVPKRTVLYSLIDEHLIFRDGVKIGDNVIKLDFTSPILASGSAIMRYIDKEDGSEYIYSLFVPSDASTAFPVFDQPDLKARFSLDFDAPVGWKVISNGIANDLVVEGRSGHILGIFPKGAYHSFATTKPISTYVFAFAAGNFEETPEISWTEANQQLIREGKKAKLPANEFYIDEDVRAKTGTHIFVRKSQATKFQPHAAEVFRLNRESIRYFEEYFDYKFPFPKYDLVLIPEFPFGGMEHAGATFLRESAIIFPQEPTKSDHISRAVLIFHEAAHQWFGDTVTMKWFDDLWLKEGFANFMAYKALERIMPEANAWKVFYERIKQPAYATDSTRGTTPIYQPIDNLNSAKSAYGNIVYNKAPAFLKQAEFYLGPEKFQTAVRAFLKKHEFKNATWEDLVKEFGVAANLNLSGWASTWVKTPGLPTFRLCIDNFPGMTKLTGRPEPKVLRFAQSSAACYPKSDRLSNGPVWEESLQFYYLLADSRVRTERINLSKRDREIEEIWGHHLNGLESKETRKTTDLPKFVFTNYQDYGYGIFLLDDKSREYVLKNVQNEKDAFLRSMMYGALWDSVREGELDPRAYVEVAIKNLPTEQDETIAQMMTGRTATALNYYMSEEGRNLSGSEGARQGTSTPKGTLPTGRVSALSTAFESVLIDRIKNASTLGQRITFYRAFLNTASSEKGKQILRDILNSKFQISDLKLKTKDKFDIVTRLAVLNDPEAAKLLAELEKTETSDDAKRYAYAARAAFPTKENREKYWNDFVANKDISESWIEAAFGPFNAVRNSELSLPYLKRALEELPNHKRSRKIFFVNGWLAAFIGGQRSQEALDIVDKFLADNPTLDKDLRLKILENVDVIERAVKIRIKFAGDSTQRR